MPYVAIIVDGRKRNPNNSCIRFNDTPSYKTSYIIHNILVLSKLPDTGIAGDQHSCWQTGGRTLTPTDLILYVFCSTSRIPVNLFPTYSTGSCVKVTPAGFGLYVWAASRSAHFVKVICTVYIMCTY